MLVLSTFDLPIVADNSRGALKRSLMNPSIVPEMPSDDIE